MPPKRVGSYNISAPRRSSILTETSLGRHEEVLCMDKCKSEVTRGKRFPFGTNWLKFLDHIDEARIALAEASLQDMLESSSLAGLSFLDVGCGSGLFSLSARRLGARVYSFDFDPDSVACARDLKKRYFPDDPDWVIGQGSALDKDFLRRLGTFDIIYAWGVLHHTGALRVALENVVLPLKPGGKLFLAIYNDQGIFSSYWLGVKRFYCSGMLGKSLVSIIYYPYFMAKSLVADIVHRRNPLQRFGKISEQRGMSVFRNLDDWLGGLPFEVAKPEKIFDFYRSRGFTLQKLVTAGGGHGNNQFVLTLDRV
jgi:2-polyprenyl-3-methyl-5-hydroxy-6-metoxy-1,4-benzoquinol methylase